VFEQMGVSPKREVMVSHFSILAQARKLSLSETYAISWVKVPGLSENGEESCLCVLFELFYLIVPELWELYVCDCDVWA